MAEGHAGALPEGHEEAVVQKGGMDEGMVLHKRRVDPWSDLKI